MEPISCLSPIYAKKRKISSNASHIYHYHHTLGQDGPKKSCWTKMSQFFKHVWKKSISQDDVHKNSGPWFQASWWWVLCLVQCSNLKMTKSKSRDNICNDSKTELAWRDDRMSGWQQDWSGNDFKLCTFAPLRVDDFLLSPGSVLRNTVPRVSFARTLPQGSRECIEYVNFEDHFIQYIIPAAREYHEIHPTQYSEYWQC